ncbi:MAG: F0F1 ATP synthase subunit epsilon [Candidatus Polarisedimenticolia bacterium]|nr:F0F1 ATP synthase subunit epsilon [bacterium]
MSLPEKIHLEIVTPERRILARDVDEVVLPGALGSFGVLPGHAPLLAELGPGIAFCRVGDRRERLAISGGYAEVGPDRVSVLAETCERAEEIDVDRARRKLDELNAELKSALPAGGEEVLRARMLKHLARLDASVGRPLP